MKKFLLVLILFFPLALKAQDCNCVLNFDYMVSHVKTDYAGFNDKIKPNNRKEFKKLTKLLRKEALNVNTTDSCYVILKTWTNQFKDNHLRVQLDWRYREKYPEVVKQVAKRFARPLNLASSPEKLAEVTSIKRLDTNTFLLRLPSFVWDEKKIIDSLLIANQEQLKKVPNWIIDLRGNDGGTDYAFNGIMPFIYSNTVKIKPDEYLSSKENIRILEENLKDVWASQAGFLTNLIALMKQHPNQFVNPSGKESFDFTADTIYQYPAKVAVLIDRNTASSAESFLLNAMQSAKVKVYGENSSGMLDYNNVQYFDIPCKDFNLVIPIGRSTRLPENPIDNIGISPNVKIDAKEPNKIDFIKRIMEK